MNFAGVERDAQVQAFEREVDEFLDEHLTADVLRHEEETGDGYHAGFHRALAARRFIAPRWSEAEGGLGLDDVRARVLLDRMWVRGAPDIFRATTILIADSLRPWASPELLIWFLPGVAAGEIRVCQGITEPDSGSDAAAAKTSARLSDGVWTVNGAKMFTSHAHNATHCYLLVRTEPDAGKHAGLTVLIVPLDRPGVTIMPIRTIGNERTNMVYLSDVEVDDEFRVGPRGEGWRVLNTQLDAEHGLSAELDVPLKYVIFHQLRRLYWACLAWAKTTSAGGGMPIEDVTVRRNLAELASDLEFLYSCPLDLSRALASDLLIRHSEACLDRMGPDGLVRYPDPGSLVGGLMELRYRSAQATATYGGSTEIFRNIVAHRVLGLPR